MQKLLPGFRDFPQVQELIRSLTSQRFSILLHDIMKYKLMVLIKCSHAK